MLSTVLEFWSDLVISFLHGIRKAFCVFDREVRRFELSHVCAPNGADAKIKTWISVVFL